jgi:hypothetical protein
MAAMASRGAGAASGASGGGGGGTVNLGGVTFNITATDGADVKAKIDAEFTSWCESLALQAGSLQRIGA